MGWFYLLWVAVFVIFVLYLAIEALWQVKLGPDHPSPTTATSWFAMLFGAGMGIGLMFFGVAEPMQHYAARRLREPATVEAAREAMGITFFHWGLHAWAIYAVVGLALAYFAYR